MSDTPRTDGCEYDTGLTFHGYGPPDMVVPAKFARQLERELAAMKRDHSLCHEAGTIIKQMQLRRDEQDKRIAALETDLACHREENDRLLKELARVTAERDDANTQLVRLRTLWERAGKSETPTLIALRAERDEALADAKRSRKLEAEALKHARIEIGYRVGHEWTTVSEVGELASLLDAMQERGDG